MVTAERPTGLVAFLFTDLEGSTRAWEQAPEQMNEVLASHDEILRSSIASCTGAIFSTAGDAFAAAFHTVGDALDAAVRAQREIAGREWPDGMTPPVRMGVHVGRAFERDANYYGPSVNRAARLMSCAHGGQIVMSSQAAGELGSDAGVELVDLGEHWLPDLPDPERIFQVTGGGLRSAFPPLESLAPPPPRIPLYRTTFVGRGDELEKMGEYLDAGGLITIVAPGGTGKTRFAYRTAITYADRYPDGVFAVELADGTAADVDNRAAESVLGDSPLANNERVGDSLTSLTSYLAERRALLVLDNCEHVLPEARRLVEAVLDAAPDVTVLATSREVMGAHGERVVPLPPLPYQTDTDDLPAAVVLYLERANAANADLALEPEELAAVQETCERLEGLPLAVELAAARVRTLAPSMILARLDDSISILKQRAEDVPERHRSLEAAIWWSWDLLEPEEQQLLAASSVFVGGFSLDALEAVAPGGEVIDGLESLVDKSLVAVEGGRYRLREPIRRFAAERLSEADAVEEAHDAHVAHFLTVATEARPELDGHAETEVIAQLRLDHDNIMAAIDRLIAREDLRGALRLAGRLHTYWEETGHLSAGLDVFEAIAGRGLGEPGRRPGLRLHHVLRDDVRPARPRPNRG